MKWEDISKHLPGRSAISCRLHYQNYLERRSEWDEDRKNKLARLYERFKNDMWSRIAEEMAIPWRAAEAMHWQMGEHEMARRAGVTPFALANTNNNVGSSQPPVNHASMNMGPRHYNPNIQQLPPSMISSAPMPHHRRNSGPSSLSQTGQPPQLPSLAELTAGLPAFAPPIGHAAHAATPTAPSSVGSPYSEYPSRRSLPPGGLSTGTAFDHLPPPGSMAHRPGTPPAGQLPAPSSSSYFPTSAPTRDMNGRRY
ncbi:uncharacterized protein HMPREF1541_11021 [Cyphellophora europaea CBS 101466]|uniref:Uncharacterized protein n=1 Tax=Cyphellophora europaea (strain CBS 101466) TaxID=1220924 RepID=W2S5M2_CYPE1|nr:uncharacterized protein HMPREF1541_11021 [Cyphellophora europaea CBS 101466]ETN43890.1 hypothetical protein HMPREF1541_11021 [Cyphellophora europaea CBS 101466]